MENNSIKFSENEVIIIKQLMESVSNNIPLSYSNKQYLSIRWLEIKNTWCDIILKEIWKPDYLNNLAEIPYFLIISPSKNDWKIFDKSMAKLVFSNKSIWKESNKLNFLSI